MTTFTSDWFTSSIPPWRRHVVPVLAGRENVRWLEVGSYEGRSALWTLDNVLTGRGSSITCVDKWEGLWMQKCAEELRFDENLLGRENVIKRVGRSEVVLPTLPRRHFHGAYIDGSHKDEDVYRDAWQVHSLLLPGALMVFDDYEAEPPRSWADGIVVYGPRQFEVFGAVNRFLKELGDGVRVLHADWQLIAKLAGEL